MTTQSEPTILLDVTDGVGWITLNRPKAYNAINTDLAERLLDAVIRCDEDDEVRALIITGKGSSFCSGGDIRQMMDAVARDGDAAAFLKRLTVSLHEATATMAHMSKPVIMAVNGAAAGAGFSLVLAGDLVLAGENARFTVAYTAIGVGTGREFDVHVATLDRPQAGFRAHLHEPGAVGKRGQGTRSRQPGVSDGAVHRKGARIRCKRRPGADRRARLRQEAVDAQRAK
jgi:enoyl-CoA hydratase/carnithine racemase